MYHALDRRMIENAVVAIPQVVVLKFVRNAPDLLRYFSSDLTQDNIQIIQHDRPVINFD